MCLQQAFVPSASVAALRQPLDSCQQPVVTGCVLQPAIDGSSKLQHIKQLLVLLIHAYKCLQREQGGPMIPGLRNSGTIQYACVLPQCHTMKKLLKHMRECQQKDNACKCE